MADGCLVLLRGYLHVVQQLPVAELAELSVLLEVGHVENRLLHLLVGSRKARLLRRLERGEPLPGAAVDLVARHGVVALAAQLANLVGDLVEPGGRYLLVT